MTERAFRRYRQGRSIRVELTMAAFLAAFSSTSANAEVRISGDVNTIRIDASRATISEILSGLGRDLGIRYRSSVALDAEIDGTYSGSLRQALSGVLAGYSYVVANGETIEVNVIGKMGNQAAARVGSATASPNRSLAAQWRSSVDAKR